MAATLGQLIAPALPGLAAAGAAAMAVPVLIHLLTRLRRRREPWAAMRFLLEAFRRQRTRMRIEQWLLLCVRCLVLGLLGLALSGPGLRGCSAAGAWAGSGRLVCLVLDDSLSTQAVEADGQPRFEGLRRAALQVLDNLGPADRVALWRAARPADGAEVVVTGDRGAVSRRIRGMTPRFTRTDLPAVLPAVRALVEREGVVAERVVLVLLSDWSGAALESQLAECARAGLRWRVCVARPAAAGDNLQLVQARPRRAMVLPESNGSVVVPMQLRVRRLTAEMPEASLVVHAGLVDGAGEPRGEVRSRRAALAAGQMGTAFGLDIVVPPEVVAASGPEGATLAVGAWLGPASGSDVLVADNRRWATVDVRRKLRVALIDVPGAQTGASGEHLSPRRWLSIALAPDASGEAVNGAALEAERVVIRFIGPRDLAARDLARLDAACVLRPDRLPAAQWALLAEAVRAGMLLWVFTPSHDEPAVWARALGDPLGLPWQVGLEIRAFDGDRGWSLGASEGAPEDMALLAADWAGLLRPVRVQRRIDLGGSAVDTWLATADGAPLLLSSVVGDGRVMLLGTALDLRWTNLPAKPLWVPLVHESLHGAVAASSPAAGRGVVRCGDRRALPRHWLDAQALHGPDGRTALRLEDDGRLAPVKPLEVPGLYHDLPKGAQRLAVNIEPDAGDTRVLDESVLTAWLDRAQSWQWLDPADPARALAEQAPWLALGWPLLWTVLALLLAETALARWFSHAGVRHSRRRRAWVAKALTGS